MSAVAAIPSTAAAASSVGKEKTKAKKRYLKAKKDRRKKRKALLSHPSGIDSTLHKQEPDTDAEQGSDSDGAESADAMSVVENEKDDAPKSVTAEEKRPRKRRRLDTSEEAPALADAIATTEGDREDAHNIAEPPPPGRKSPTPPVALPSFPRPTRPDAPSKTTLALQGLDKALVEAELVDPAKTLLYSSELGPEDGTGLSEKARKRLKDLGKRLKDLGITELFAVQTAVVPFLLSPDQVKSLYLPYHPPRDLCVSAPTGSGKTLAYALPIVEILSSRIVTRLRALIVLPTRDLVTQVRETFEAVAKGRGLKIGTATGQHSFAHEQAQLVADRSVPLQGGSSKVDVLICTPGRLMDHLNGTPNFSLQHLRFLVIDEADRLLAQSFQDWLAQVLAATRPPPTTDSATSAPSEPIPGPSHSSAFPRADALAPAFLHTFRDVPHVRTDIDEKRTSSCQKLLFSATLTRDPAKTSALNLHDPKYFIVQTLTERQGADGHENGEGDAPVLDLVMERFSMPATLSEHMLVCESSVKPLMLFHLVHAHGVTNALVFTKSAESTSRLVRLLEFFEAARAAAEGGHSQIVAHAYSSDLYPSERKTILDKFKSQEIHILVCSDLISRGIDISHVSHVVSYDAPVDMRKYVHRVGRTARAGRSGDAWTLVEVQEARYFKTLLKEAGHLERVKRLRVSEKDVAPLQKAYESALNKLKETYGRSAT